jgi:hypothetical protein
MEGAELKKFCEARDRNPEFLKSEAIYDGCLGLRASRDVDLVNL